MPVARLQRTVTPAPVAGVRLTAAETPESEGAGLAQAQARGHQQKAALFGDLSQLAGHEAAAIAENEQKQADATSLLAYQNGLATWEEKRLYGDGTNTGALFLQGKDSFGLPETLADEFNAQADAAGAKLPRRLQGQAAQIRAQRSENLDLTVRRYVGGQIQKDRADELAAGLENKRNEAGANALDPPRVAQSVADGVKSIQDVGPSLGMGAQQLKEQVDKFTSAVHVTVINRLLANDQTTAARLYYQGDGTDAHPGIKEQVAGTARADVEKALNEGSLRKQSQQKAQDIIGATTDQSARLAAVEKIDDADLQDAVRQRVEHQNAIDDKAQNDRERDIVNKAYTLIDQNAGNYDAMVKGLPADELASIGQHKAALRSYAEHVSLGKPIVTNWQTFYDLVNEAGNTPQKFVGENLWEYRTKLDDGKFSELASLQLQYKQKDNAGAARVLEGYRTSVEVINDSLAKYGIDPKDDPQATAILRQTVDDQVASLERNSKTKAGPQDVQSIVDGILSKNVDVPGSYWGLLKIPSLGIAGYLGAPNYFASTKPLIKLKVGDIPAEERKVIEGQLRAAHLPTSDAMVLQAYIEVRARRK